MNVLRKWLKIGYWGNKNHIPGLCGFMNLMIRRTYSCDIPSSMYIPDSVQFKHNALGVVINAATKIGENVVIFQNVTIGKKEDGGLCPTIGNNVVIGAGAIVLGNINIGDGAKIGAGTTVAKDIPAGATVVSGPNRVIVK